MQNEQILPRYVMDLEHVDWEALVSVTNTRYWMGLAERLLLMLLSSTHENCSRFPKKHVARGQLVSQEEDLQTIHGLALPIYERGSRMSHGRIHVAGLPQVPCVVDFERESPGTRVHASERFVSCCSELSLQSGVSSVPHSILLDVGHRRPLRSRSR
jgi:hypothetical protein